MACLTDVKVIVYLLVILFGMGSWAAVNGLWVELPILVSHAPEAWNLASYITVIIQIANVGPLLYILLNKLTSRYITEKHGVFFIVIVGGTASLLLVFVWNKTSFIEGVDHSTWLLICAFFLSLVDCMSSVVFLPYMSQLKHQYISALYIGEGLSGMVPSLAAIAQGVGTTVCVNKTVNQTTTASMAFNTDDQSKIVSDMFPEYEQPTFSVEVFFYFQFAIVIICGLAFVLLEYLPYCASERTLQECEWHTFIVSNSLGYINYEKHLERQPLLQSVTDFLSRLSTKKHVILFIQVGFINAIINGILPSISSFACMTYGRNAYHFSTTLSSIANPLTCLVVFFLPVATMRLISGTMLLGVGGAVYIIVVAACSPNPPLAHESSGTVIIVMMFVLVTILMTFSKVSIARVLRESGHRALLMCGIITQFGSTLGAVLMFVLVDVFQLFHDKQPCE